MIYTILLVGTFISLESVINYEWKKSGHTRICVFLCVGCVLWKEKNKYFSSLRNAAIED